MSALCCHAAARGAVAVALLVLTTAPVLAQPRALIGARPAPNQTVRLRLVQKMDLVFAAVAGAAPPALPPGGLVLENASVLVLRQDVGAIDDRGRLRLDVTYEEVSQRARLNGAPVPIPADSVEELLGKTVTMWMGPKREVLEVITPPNFPLEADQMEQILGPLQASMPFQEMSLGEVVRLPFSMRIPIPVPGSAGPQMMLGHTKTKLARLTPDGGDQLAFLEQSIDLVLSGTTSTRGPNVSLGLRMDGTGTTETFVSAATLKTTNVRAKMTGRFETAGSAVASMKISGSFTMDLVRVE
jgi:hypothetical protein